MGKVMRLMMTAFPLTEAVMFLALIPFSAIKDSDALYDCGCIHDLTIYDGPQVVRWPSRVKSIAMHCPLKPLQVEPAFILLEPISIATVDCERFKNQACVALVDGFNIFDM